MSTPSDLDLDSMFLPAWAQEPANKNLYSSYEGEPERSGRREGRGDRDRGDRARPRGESRGPRPPQGVRGPQSGGPRGQRGPQDRRGGPRDSHGGQQRRHGRPEQPKPAPIALPEVDAQFRPTEEGVESLARQIKITGRAYPLFGIAQLVLERPERYNVVLSVKKKDGSIVQPLFVCALDESVWLSENDAVAHILEKHFETFYKPERTQTEPPKGVYTFVAQCGMSGVILGPPNHHDYQNQLRRLHTERFSRMPFDMFKSRVKIVRDEAVVKKWVEDQSWKTEYECLNVSEALKLASRDDVEKHFRATHLANIVRQVESQTLDGKASRAIPCRPLYQLVRERWHEQQRFPLQLATVLSQQFANRGLQFFKVNRTVTHVSVARPHFLDLETTPVSDNVKKLVEFIQQNPKCSRRKLFEALAPSALTTMQPAAEGAPVPELTPEASAIIADLHWLVHQGHVIEFANGTMETAKKPQPKPVKAEATPREANAEAAASESVVVTDTPTEAALASEGTATEVPSSQPEGEATPSIPS